MDHSGGFENVGKHRVRFIPPDVFHFEIHGDVSTDDVHGIFNKAEALAATLPPGIFWITDARAQGHVSEAARKATAMRSAAIGVRAFAMLGASFTVRVIALMMAKAARLLNRKITRDNTGTRLTRWDCRRIGPHLSSKDSALFTNDCPSTAFFLQNTSPADLALCSIKRFCNRSMKLSREIEECPLRICEHNMMMIGHHTRRMDKHSCLLCRPREAVENDLVWFPQMGEA